MRNRGGFSLIELLIALGILALLIGLTLSAVQRVRVAAYKTQSANNLRQIALGFQQFADQQDGVIKGLDPYNLPAARTSNGGWTTANIPSTCHGIMMDILPWTYGNLPTPPPNPTPEQLREFAQSPVVRMYTSPADPTLHNGLPNGLQFTSKCSYSHNAQVFHDTLKIPASLPDGMSNTISFTERYFRCGIQHYVEFQLWDDGGPPVGPPPFRNERRSTFADPAAFDVYPILDFNGRTVASQPGRTFQVRPRFDEADGKLPQTPYEGGLLVSFFDGSVRTIRAGVSESSFWGMVTPAGGEVPGDD